MLKLGSIGTYADQIDLIDLGHMPYREAWLLQKSLVEERVTGKIVDTLLFVEHPPVITLGRGAQRGLQTLLSPDPGTEVLEVERGGLSTYHGPGQLVAYPIFHVGSKRGSEARNGVVGLIRALEDWLIASLSQWKITGQTITGQTGVWIEGKPLVEGGASIRKVASIGIALRRWVSYHGIALNYSTGTDVWRQINPCGFDSGVMSDLSAELDRQVTRDEVLSALLSNLPSLLRKTENSPTIEKYFERRSSHETLV